MRCKLDIDNPILKLIIVYASRFHFLVSVDDEYPQLSLKVADSDGWLPADFSHS
jgi:hypothetical protein